MSDFLSPAQPASPVNPDMFAELSGIAALREKIAQLPAATRFTDEQIEVIYSIGHTLFTQGKIDNAFGVFQVLLVYRPLEVRFLSAFGICCKRLSRYDDAVSAFTAALLADPRHLESAVHLTESLAALGKKDQSLSVLTPLIELTEMDAGYANLHKRAVTLRELLEKS
jgi:Flp pilus assembly protein TadD